MAKTLITKELKLNLKDVPLERRSAVKKEIGDYLVDEILSHTSSGKSPVGGEGSFKRLSKEYAAKEKNGNRTPNLRLEGDLLDALNFKNTRGGIEIGIMKKSQEGKADGHNNFTGKSSLPRRRFIPDENQVFTRNIMKEVDSIIKENEKETPRPRRTTPTSGSDDGATATLTLEDLFTEDSLNAFLQRSLSGS